MEQSRMVVILLCALCIPAALPSGSGSGLRLRSGLEPPLGSGSEPSSGLGSEPPLGSGLPSGSELPVGLGSGSEPPSGLEPPSVSGSEPPLGSELPLGSGWDSEPSSVLGSEPPLGSELPSGLGSDSEPLSGSESPLGSELPSGLGSDSEPLSGSESPSGSELPSGSGSGLEPPSGLGSEPPSGSELSSGSAPPLGLEPPSGPEPPSGSAPPSGSEPPLGPESFPLGLRAVVLVNSTPCTVTCGLGLKEEQRCEVTPAGEMQNCSLVRSRCLSDWLCGLQHLSVPQGKPFQLVCLSPEAASLEGQNFGYTWRFSQGLITTNDLLFHAIRNPSPSLRFSPALESHSGTYRCDVQVLSSFQIVKRIYFGLRVIPSDLVDLDFQKSLTWEQQLAANGEEAPANGSGPAELEERRKFWETLWIYEVVLGLGSGVIVGILFSIGLCCLGRVCRRRAAGEMNGD